MKRAREEGEAGWNMTPSSANMLQQRALTRENTHSTGQNWMHRYTLPAWRAQQLRAHYAYSVESQTTQQLIALYSTSPNLPASPLPNLPPNPTTERAKLGHTLSPSQSAYSGTGVTANGPTADTAIPAPHVRVTTGRATVLRCPGTPSTAGVLNHHDRTLQAAIQVPRHHNPKGLPVTPQSNVIHITE